MTDKFFFGFISQPQLQQLQQLHRQLQSNDSAEILEQILEAIVFSAVIFMLTLFILALVRMSRSAAEKSAETVKRLKQDDFQKQFGYSWDYVFVFKIYAEEELPELNYLQARYSMKLIIDRCKNSRIQTRLFYSCQRDEIYVKFRADMKRLLREADRVDYKLMFDANNLKKYVENGVEGKWAGIHITDEFRVGGEYGPFDYIYAKYDERKELQVLYRQYKADPDEHDEENAIRHPLRSVDRIKLLLSIMEADANEAEGGCGFMLNSFDSQRVLLARFPIHNYTQLRDIQDLWLKASCSPQDLPIEEIRDYFGERIALHVAFVKYFIQMIFIPAILGTLAFIVRLGLERNDDPFTPAVAALVALWTTVFSERWKREQSRIAMEWGMNGFEEEEQDRAEYKGVETPNPVDGSIIKYYEPKNKIFDSLFIILVCVICVLVILAEVALLATVQWALTEADANLFDLGGSTTSTYLTGVMLLLLIMGNYELFVRIAPVLNNIENHRTETNYEDALVAKLFVFQFLNSYAYLFFVAFIKPFTALECPNLDCPQELSDLLLVQFLSPLLISVVSDVIVRDWLTGAKVKRETSNIEPDRKVGVLEHQFILPGYDGLQGVLGDYARLAALYGYTVLFVAVFPVAPLLCLVTLLVKVRVLGWKFCQAYRRPTPRPAEDIGVWEDVFEFTGVVCVVFSFGLVFFVSDYAVDVTWEYRWIIFILLEHFTFVIKIIIDLAVEDEPGDVLVQLQRQDFLNSKVISNEEDEKDEAEQDNSRVYNLRIEVTDSDWVYPLPEQEINLAGDDGFDDNSNDDDDDAADSDNAGGEERKEKR